MSVPKSRTKVKRDGSCEITYMSNAERCQYTMQELIRGALRDTGKFLAKNARLTFYSEFDKTNGQVGRGIGYWARSRSLDLQFGMSKKNIGFWGGILDSKRGLNILRNTVLNNLGEIQRIQGAYLSRLSNENPSLSDCSEGDYTDEG